MSSLFEVVISFLHISVTPTIYAIIMMSCPDTFLMKDFPNKTLVKDPASDCTCCSQSLICF